MRRTYGESFAILRERVEIVGEPRPIVERPPRHDDEDVGPSIVRAAIDDVALDALTLSGLYVGRSELRNISFRDTDLRLATFNWSDLLDCDFTGADLSGADLRACRFERCVFRSANLARTDVRGSTFELCTFEAASLDRAKLYRTPRLLGLLKRGRDQTNLPLSETQRRDVEWCADAPAPGGG